MTVSLTERRPTALVTAATAGIGFFTAAGLARQGWAVVFHLDVTVDQARLDEAERQVLALGTTKHELQPGGNWRVYVDPIGHPFSLCWD